jgi:predicted secreted acid phosphatase
MLLGDNLNDFSKIFEKGSSAERARETDFQNYNWGKKFIVLPNVMYGEWINAIYDYNKRLNSEQKEEIRLRQLKGTDL